MGRTTVAAAIRAALSQAFHADDRLIALGEGVGRTGGLDGLFADIDPSRRLETPVADRGSLGLALGLALAGKRPILELSSSGRLHAGLELLAEAAETYQAGELPVDLLVRVPTGGQAGPRIDRSATGALAAIDGLRILAPGTPDTVVGAYRAALGAKGPTVLLDPRALLGERCTADTPANAPGAAIARTGHDLTLIAWGSGVEPALAAADALAAQGLQAEVIDLRRAHPLDAVTIGESVRRTGRAVVVTAPEGGLSDRALRAAIDHAFLYLESPLRESAPEPAEIARAAVDAVDW